MATRVPTIDDCLAMLLDVWNFGRFFSSSRAVGSMASTRLVLLSDFPFTTIFLCLLHLTCRKAPSRSDWLEGWRGCSFLIRRIMKKPDGGRATIKGTDSYVKKQPLSKTHKSRNSHYRGYRVCTTDSYTKHPEEDIVWGGVNIKSSLPS